HANQAAASPGGQHMARLSLARENLDGLAALSRHHRVPLGVLIQASWALLLRRYRSADSVLFGLTVAHRPADLERNENLVGMTINTVPVRADMTRATTLADLLGALREQAFEREPHAHLGLDDILQAAGLHHEGVLPFDTLLLAQNYPRPGTLQTGG